MSLNIEWGSDSGSSSDDDDFDFDSLKISDSCCNEVHLANRDFKGKIGKKFFVECEGNDRNLDWEVKAFKPNSKSDPLKKDKNLIGEMIYGRKGKPMADNCGEFGFKDPEYLKCHAGKCRPDTPHARLHRELYGKCPEEEDGLVATGFSYQTDKGLVFRSTTFNDKRKSYVDKMFYGKKPTREAGTIEQNLIQQCMDKWCKDNSPLENWRFPVSQKK